METKLQKRHPFSFTIGEGGYKFVGSFDLGAALRHVQNFGDSAAAFRDAPKLESGMGTCSHCGQAILNIMIVQRGDGKLYGVGSDCIRKVSAEGDVSGISEMEREIRQKAKQKRRDREAQDVADLSCAYEAALKILESKPHPNEYFASKGKTAADYYRFISKNSANMAAAINESKRI